MAPNGGRTIRKWDEQAEGRGEASLGAVPRGDGGAGGGVSGGRPVLERGGRSWGGTVNKLGAGLRQQQTELRNSWGGAGRRWVQLGVERGGAGG